MPPGLPNPPNVPQFMPRQPGESAYAYRVRRSVETTGLTPYQRRIASGQAQGLSRAEARGHGGLIGGRTEAQQAEYIYQQRYGMTRSQYRLQQADQWLAQNGFTPRATGWTQTQLRRAEPSIRFINENSSPEARVSPALLLEGKDLERTGVIAPNESNDLIRQRAASLRAYQRGDKNPGRQAWYGRDERLPDVWWYYHP